MLEETLEKMRTISKIKKDKLEEYNTLKIKFEKLKENPIVKEYLETNKKLKEIPKDIKINFSYMQYLWEIDEKDTNGIYVYLGSYKEVNNETYKADYYFDNAQYRKYQNIEQKMEIEIPVSDSRVFEETHNVIFPNSKHRIHEFNMIRSDFFEDAVENGQEHAKELILSKYRK